MSFTSLMKKFRSTKLIMDDQYGRKKVREVARLLTRNAYTGEIVCWICLGKGVVRYHSFIDGDLEAPCSNPNCPHRRQP